MTMRFLPWALVVACSDGSMRVVPNDGDTIDVMDVAPGDAPIDGLPLRYALAFDGTDDVVRVPTVAALDTFQAITIELWAKPVTMAGTGAYLAKNLANTSAAYAVGRTAAGNVLANLHDGGATSCPASSPLALPVNVWSHVAITWQGSVNGPVLVYVDGELVRTTACQTRIATSSSDLFLGAAQECS